MLIHPFNAYRAAVIVLTWTAGTALVMWLAELITQRGIGNGMSILILVSVVSRMPFQGGALLAESGALKFTVILLIGFVMILAIVAVESGQRRIPVQFAKRVVGRRMYGGQSTYIPLKVNQSGVIPVIFASSLLSFPAIIATVLPWAGAKSWINSNLVGMNTLSWFYMLGYGTLILFFSYFYTSIAFNPAQQADIIRKQGGFIPGIRPGPPTERYLAKVLNRITLARRAVPDRHRVDPDVRAEVLEHHRVPVRRRVDPDHRGRDARDDEPDRQPAHDAQLRRLPRLKRRPLAAASTSGREGADPRSSLTAS